VHFFTYLQDGEFGRKKDDVRRITVIVALELVDVNTIDPKNES